MLKHMISSNSVVGNHHHHGNGGVHLGNKPGQRAGLNHSYHSANNQLHRHLNVSALSASKHSLGSVSPQPQPHTAPKLANGGLHLAPAPLPLAATAPAALPPPPRAEAGVREMLTSLGLLCLISLLLALLSLIFLLKISPVTAGDVKDLLRTEQLTVISPDEYVVVYEVTLALCALSLSLDLCCLLVCSVQFLFAVKLVRDSPGGERTNKYLKKSAVTRVCAVGGFFVSIPVFLTGIILYTFIQFHSTPAIVTSILIGLGIIFCGCAMVHNVFVWQKEKTNAVKALVQEQRLAAELKRVGGGVQREGAPSSLSPSNVLHATLDLSSVATTPHELSTLV